MFRKLLFTAALVASSTAVAAPPAKFLTDAMKGDNSEVRLGQLISRAGASYSVRDFGNTLVTDHSQAKSQVVDLARQIHVRPTNAIMPEARSEEAKLRHLRGPAFDREVRRYMINDHRKDIAKFRAQARSGDRRTADLARQQLPVLEKHLRIAESLRG
jgi:putative membrane protein